MAPVNPRITPLPAAAWDDRARDALKTLIPADRRNPDGAGNVLSTLVRHPDLAAAYVPFNTYLLRSSKLSDRVREVALLRVVHRCNCSYLWTHHIPIAQRAGLTDENIESIRVGTPSDPLDQVVVRAVDDLDGQLTVSTDTWNELGDFFDDPQRMDLVFTIGGYHLLALAVNTFGIEGEEG